MDVVRVGGTHSHSGVDLFRFILMPKERREKEWTFNCEQTI